MGEGEGFLHVKAEPLGDGICPSGLDGGAVGGDSQRNQRLFCKPIFSNKYISYQAHLGIHNLVELQRPGNLIIPLIRLERLEHIRVPPSLLRLGLSHISCYQVVSRVR